MKRVTVIILLICGLWAVPFGEASLRYALGCGLIFAQEDAQERAEEIHKIASSDAIFVEEELKALYYQNVQIIELLREIRDLLQVQVVDEGEEG